MTRRCRYAPLRGVAPSHPQSFPTGTPPASAPGPSSRSASLWAALALLASFSVGALSAQDSQILKASENTRLEASICPDAMNRLAVANDRIAHIFGDEGTFESQHEEATGQVFLKPTAENGSKSLSLTLITEHGLTQDLTLTPTAKSPKTLILHRDPANQDSGSQDSPSQDSPSQDSPSQDSGSRDFPGGDLGRGGWGGGEFDASGLSQGSWKVPERRRAFHQAFPHASAAPCRCGRSISGEPASGEPVSGEPVLGEPVLGVSIQERLLTLLKYAMRGQLPLHEKKGVAWKASAPEGYSVTPVQSWQAGPYVVHALSVENVMETPMTLQETDFYRPGDLALSFEGSVSQERILPARGKTTLYVVCLRKRDLP